MTEQLSDRDRALQILKLTSGKAVVRELLRTEPIAVDASASPDDVKRQTSAYIARAEQTPHVMDVDAEQLRALQSSEEASVARPASVGEVVLGTLPDTGDASPPRVFMGEQAQEPIGGVFQGASAPENEGDLGEQRSADAYVDTLAAGAPSAFQQVRNWLANASPEKRRVLDVLKFFGTATATYGTLTAVDSIPGVNIGREQLLRNVFTGEFLIAWLVLVGKYLEAFGGSIERGNPRAARLIAKVTMSATVKELGKNLTQASVAVGKSPWIQGVMAGAAAYGIIGPIQIHNNIDVHADQQTTATENMSSGEPTTTSTEPPPTTIPNTEVPLPTSTQEPTQTPLPTDTVSPTETLSPTDTPLPTETPIPTHTPPSPTPEVVGEAFNNISTVWGHELEFARGLVDIQHAEPVANGLKNIAWGLSEGKNIGQLGSQNVVELLNRFDATKFARAVNDIVNGEESVIGQLRKDGLYDLIRELSVVGRHATAEEAVQIARYFVGN